MRIPITNKLESVTLDSTHLVGSLTVENDRLIARFVEPIRREDFFKIFPGAGVMLLDSQIVEGEQLRFLAVEILQLSVYP